MGLTEYRRKRDFRKTPEPAGDVPRGKKATTKGWSFVIQKHDARRLHYDFRLELDGVLKSWAVPKGPSLDPREKRLAVQTEDHPLEYGGFEGVIPEGEYGGGTVLIWDRGHWEPLGDPHQGLRKGELKFILHGEKLGGSWVLVRLRSTSEEGRNWLLIKHRDEAARPLDQGDVLEEEPLSVASGRDLGGIAAAKARVWSSNRSSNGRSRSRVAAKPKKRYAFTPRQPPGAKAARLPSSVHLQLATLTDEAPEGDQWLHEIKLDGYRMACRIDGRRVEFVSRNQKTWTEQFSFLTEAVKKLPFEKAILDGEVVAMKPDGTTDFQLLQNAFREGRQKDLFYYAFDLLYYDGWDLRGAVLEERKQLLAEALASMEDSGPVRFSEHISGSGPEFFARACEAGVEGIISKRRDRPYAPGRGYEWLKVKCLQHAEFVVGGYTPPAGSRKSFGALLIGYYDDQKRLLYAGKVGTGFDQATLADLLARLEPLRQEESPFARGHGPPPPRKGAQWVKPRLVAQIRYTQWTRDGMLRHPSFQGLREDKPAAAVGKEEPVPAEEAVKKAAKPKRAASKRTSTRRGKAHDVAANDGQPPAASAMLPVAAEHDVAKKEFQGVRLTSPEKVLDPKQGLTKLELAAYYATIADWILPHLAGRPLVLVRCPDGRHKECFYQKHPALGTPENLRQIPIREKNETRNYIVVDDAEGLISLAQIGTLEIHVWGSKEDRLEQPDRLVFDLDPDPAVPWKQVVQSAREVRQVLEDLGLMSFLKTTGGKGLHLVVPIQRRHEWDEVKDFCRLVAKAVVTADPSRYTLNMSKAARPGKIFLDYLRNGRGATSVVAYSTRAKPGAPISTPLAWDELSADLRSDHFNVRNLPQRLAGLKHDPWEDIASVRQSLTQAMRAKLGE